MHAGEQGYVPSDFAKLLEESDVTVSKIDLSGEIRFTKKGNVEIDLEDELKLDYKGEIDLSKVDEIPLDSLNVKAGLETSSKSTIEINFEKEKSYLDKLPSEEELATYYEMDGEAIREKIKELFSKVDELER